MWQGRSCCPFGVCSACAWISSASEWPVQQRLHVVPGSQLKQFLAFPIFWALDVCTSWMPFFFSFPACVYICKVGVGRANAWSIRNWNGMSQGWLKAKMKYISLGSRGAWGSPVILDNLFFFHLLSPICTSADLLFWVLGSPCWAIRALLERGQEKVQAVGSVLVSCAALGRWPVYLRRARHPLAQEPRPSEGRSYCPPPSPLCWLKMVPTGSMVPGPLGIREELSPRGTVLSVTCVPAGVSDRQQLSERLSLLRTASARPGLGRECISSTVCSLCQRQSGRSMAQVRISLGALPEKCSTWLLAQGAVQPLRAPQLQELWQAQEDAALEVVMRQKGEARISVNKWLQTVFKVPSASSRAECLACVLGTLPLQALKMLLEVDAFIADFPFFFFPFLSFFFPFLIFCFCIWMLAGSRIQVRAEKAGLPGAGIPGKAVGSSAAANPEVFAASPFCTHCLLPGTWSSNP